MIDYKGPIIIIAGPTASGKSNIAIKVAKKVNGYIINADSRQLYKELNIGTAKPKFDKKISEGVYMLDGIKHILYDFVDPKEKFSIFEYQNLVNTYLNNEKGIPILVGGTGLYIDSVIFNYKLKRKNSSTNLKDMNIVQLQEVAKDYLSDMNESDRNNRHRLIRTIERGTTTKERGKELNGIYFVIDIEKEILKKKVKERIERMFKEGLLEENSSLLNKGYTYEHKGMNSIGYIEFKEYYEKKISIEDVKEEIFKNTMKYIKRQRTWFKRNSSSIWTDNEGEIVTQASNFVLKV